jgi:hypothetical protein
MFCNFYHLVKFKFLEFKSLNEYKVLFKNNLQKYEDSKLYNQEVREIILNVSGLIQNPSSLSWDITRNPGFMSGGSPIRINPHLLCAQGGRGFGTVGFK